MAEGIEVRHQKHCTGRGKSCCVKSYRASVWSNRDGRRVKKTFATMAAAKAWRHDAKAALRSGAMRAAAPITFQEAADKWLADAQAGIVRSRSGDRYAPATLRDYEAELRLRALAKFGYMKLGDIRPMDIQDYVHELSAEGLSESAVVCALNPLRRILGKAVRSGDIAVNPCTGVETPAVRGGRDRIATATEAADLIAALPTEQDQAVWSVAFYAGLRRGEIRALRVRDIDLETNRIRVARGWDRVAGEQPTKGKRNRPVPIAQILREPLLAWLMRSGRRARPNALVFGTTDVSPLDDRRLTERADEAWKAAGLKRITLHECRHTFASLMIAAGVNGKALSTYMGHSSIQVTYDRYGHLMPGNEDEAGELLDAYIRTSGVAGTS